MKQFSIQLLVLLGLSYSLMGQQVKFNEVQTSNSKTQIDPDFYKFKDWVELYNTGSSSVDLSGYFITDDKNEPRKWQIPSGQSIAPKGYVLIYCDGENVTGKAMHTNFRLSAEGESLYLYSSTMLLVDTVTVGRVETDYTYGRVTNGTGVWAALSEPTPNASNVSTTVKGVASKPAFSKVGGFYNANQTITLSSSIPGAVIRYTTDGSEPTESSPEYTKAITASKQSGTSLRLGYDAQNKTQVQQYSWEDPYGKLNSSYYTNMFTSDVNKAFVLKAKVFHDDYVPSPTVCQTYFINMNRPSLPVVSVVTDKANFFNADSGIYIQGTNGIYSGGSGDVKANWNQDWERKGYVEYYDASGTRQFGVNAGLSAMGAVSRHTDLKSLNVIMRNEYEPGAIEYPIFGDDGNNVYESFLLRNSGNDWEQGVFARDAMFQSIVRGQFDMETQDYQPVVMYLNGEYWSMINMRERYDKRYFSAKYDYVDANEIDILKIDGDKDAFNPSSGDSLRWVELFDYLKANSMADANKYNYVKNHYLDVDNMITYYITQLYCQNTDWPNNNFRLWRPKTENGKFRFPLYDTDFGYGLYGGGASSNPYENFDKDKTHITVALFYYMMKNEDFYNEFIQRFYYMINTVYDATRSKGIIDNIENTISTERATSDDFWARSETAKYSGYGVSSVRSFADERPSNMRSFLNSKYGNKGTSTLTVNYNDSQGLVTLCGLDVTTGYAGAQYKSTPIRMNAIPKKGYKFVGWKVGGTTVSTDEEYKLTITASTTVEAVFQTRTTESGLYFNEVMAANSSTIQNENLKYEDWFEIYNSSSAPINLAGLYLSDDPATPLKYKIPYGTPDSTTVPAKGYIVFWADNESQDGPLHCPFKLDKSGDTLLLSQVSSSGTVTTLATLTFVSQNPDVSYGCYPDANANKIVFTTPTPRATNKVSSTNMLSAGDLVITELMAKNESTVKEETGTYADWFEVHNTTNADIDMGGLFVTNDLNNLNMYYIPKGQPTLTTVPAGGYLLFWADKQVAINPNHVGFKLPAEQGEIAIVQLQSSSNLIIDKVSYANQGEDVSYGRYPSATFSFVYLINPTPGAKNVSNGTIALKDGLKINEVLAQNTSIVADENGLYSDYIEFYNTTGAGIDLGGLFISDSANYSLRYRIPQGYSAKTTVGSKDWLVFWADDSSSLGADHLGFSLDVLGEDVVLSQIASDGSIHTIDAVTFGAQSANISYGRYTDGVDYWESMTPTYDAANQSLNSSTALKTLTTSAGNITPTVSSSVTEYVCQLPAGTETVPTISATAVNSGATVSIKQASSLTSTATVNVISKNGYYSTDYIVSFLITESSDATLASLTLGGGTFSPSFNPDSTNYVAALTTTSVPYVTAIPTNKNSMVEIDYAATVSEATTITVTAEDGTTKVYTITYETTTSQNVVTEWTDDFADGVGGFTVHATTATNYVITPNNGSVDVVLNETAAEPVSDYAYFEYHLPTGYVLNGTSALNVSMDITSYLDGEVVDGYTIGTDGQYVSFYIAMVDAYGNVSDYVEYLSTVNTNTESISFDMSTATYVTKSVIVAVRLAMYGPNQTRKPRTKAVIIDNLVIGPKTSGGGTQVPQLSSDATLKTITTTLGTLSPTVSNSTKSYTLTLPAGTTTIPTISATAVDNTATVEVAQSESLDGTAYVRIISEDMTVINDFTIDVVLTPSVVDGYTDYIIQPAMTGWSESSNLYALTYNSGEVKVNYTRSSALSDAITYDLSESANKILDLTNYPYASIALSSTVATTLTAELFDANGNVTTSVTADCVAGTGVTTYLFNFTDKFSSADEANIYGIKLYFDKGSATAKSGTIAIDELRFGSKVVLETNEAPVWAIVANQSIYQGSTFTNISLYNFVSDDYTADANLTLAIISGGENVNAVISSGGVLSISVKDASWIGSEKITIRATDDKGLFSSTTITFTVEELQIALNSVAFTQTSVNVAQNATVDLLSYLTYSPTNATIESITWSLVSDNAVISTDGVVTNNLDYGTETATATVVVVDKNGNSYEKTISVVLTGCPTKLTQVSLNQSTLDLYYQETAQLAYTLTPSGACEKSVSYTSSNTSVATVSSTGLITAQSVAGTAVITVSLNDGFSVKTKSCTVTVSKDCTGDIVLSLDKSDETIVEGSTLTITPSITPDDECTQSNVITWISSDESVATVVDGVVTAVAPGIATITASTTGNGTTTATCKVTVVRDCVSEGIHVSLNTSAETLYLSSVPLQLTATYTPENLCDETMVWTSSSESVATVSSTGLVTSVSYGTTVIKAESIMDATSYATATITVVEKEVTSVTLNSTTLALLIGEEQVLEATVSPADADDPTIIWESSNTSVATVDANGKVTAVAEGKANIVATAASGVSKSCAVTVSPVEVTSISLNISEVTLTQGDNQTVTVTFEPDSATNQTLTWVSSDPSVATVVDGVITAIAEGTTTITVETANGISKTIDVTVDALTIAVESVTISGESANMYIAGTMQLNATVLPTEATNQTITWKSSNTAIATVSSTGLVTAKAAGDVTITASSANAKSDAVAISVIYRTLSSVTLPNSPVALAEGGSANLSTYLTINPAATEIKSTTWELSSTEHASITAAGVITNNLDFGQETITAQVTVVDMYGISKTATIDVILTGCATEISSVSIATSVDLSMSETYTLSPVYTPSTACVESVSYVSNNTSVVTVVDGIVTPKSIGETTILATFSDGFNAYEKTISVSVESTKIPVTSLTFSSTTYSIFVGDTLQMNVSILPIDATNQNVTWTTTNASVATISETGELIGLSAGNTTIKAISSDGPTATCIVYVSAVPVTSVVLNSTTNSMYVYDTYQLQATVNPSNATDKTITWASSNEAIATVSATGLVTAVKAGSCEISATSSNNKVAKCQITVLDIEPESITVSASSCKLDIGKTQSITVSFNPSNVTNTSLDWASSNVTIATVSEDGTITAVSAGTATITVTTANGISKQITVTVNEQLATSISLNSTTATLQEGEQQTLVATILPANTTNQTVTWETSDPTVATVDANGKITAVAVGDAVITATTANGLKAECSVSVTIYTVSVTSVVISPETLDLYIGGNSSLSALISPSNASNKSVTWSSSKSSVATVDQLGNITALSVGTTTIKATASNNVYGTCVVTVKAVEVETVSLAAVSLAVGESQTLSPTITPSNATDQSITWSVTNNAIATISSTGKITGVAEGSTIVRATSSNGVVGSAMVTVSATAIEVKSITAKASNYVMSIGDQIDLSSLVTFTPSNATNKALSAVITSSVADYEENAPVVSVSDTTITALVAGTARLTITATSSNVSTTIEIGVNPIGVSSISLNKNNLELVVNASEQLTATVLPENASNKNVEWSSSNSSIVYVSADGLVRALAVGSAEITVTSKYNSLISTTCAVTVAENPVTNLTPSESSLSMNVGDIKYVTLSVLPLEAANSEINLESSNDSVVTVSKTKTTNEVQIIAKGLGTAVVTATASSGVSCQITCTVKTPNITPQVIENIPDQTLAVGSSVVIDLSKYFYDEDQLLWAMNDMGSNISCEITSSGVATFTVKDPKGTGGEQYVSVKATDSEGLQASCTILFTVTGIDEEGPNAIEDIAVQTLKVYPNPTEGPVKVSFETASAEACLIEVYSTTGMKVKEYHVVVNGKYSRTVDLSGNVPGCYIMVVTTENSKKQVTIVLK